MGMPVGIAIAVNRLQEKLGGDWSVRATEEGGLCATYVGHGNFEEASGKVLKLYRGFNVEVKKLAAK